MPDSGTLTAPARGRRSTNGRARLSLDHVADVLSSSLDYHLTLRSVTALVVPRMADWCMMFVADDGESLTPRLILAHANPSRERTLQSLWRRHPAELPLTHPISECVRTAAPVLIPDCSPDVLRSVVYTPEDADTLAKIGLRSLLVLPLMAHGLVLGGIMLAGARQNWRPYHEGDIEPLMTLAGLCARALYNARLYREAKLALRLRDELIGAVSADLLDRLAQTRASVDMVRWQSNGVGATSRRDLSPRLKAMEALVSEMEDLVRGLRGVAEQDVRG